MKIRSFWTIVLALCTASVLSAQTAIQVQKAQLSVPFGTVEGKLVVVGGYLIFIDDDNPETSFAIARSEVKSITTENDMLTVETHRPIRDRSGERSRVSLRVPGGDIASLAGWSNAPPTTPAGTPTGMVRAEPMSYQARHNHLIGGCRGRLIIDETRVAYESIDRIQDSRQWQLKDIKEIHLKNPYQIEIDPFVGSKYKLQLEGRGMDSGEYKILVDRITAARVAR